MDKKIFSQTEVNRIVATRVKRERERLIKEFENKLDQNISILQKLMGQGICEMRRENASKKSRNNDDE